MRRTFSTDFRLFFLRGLAVLLPSVLTIWIVVQAYRFVDKNVADPINAGVRIAVVESVKRFVDPDEQPEWFVVSDQSIENEVVRRQDEGLPPLRIDQVREQIRQRAFRAWWDKHPTLNFIGLGIAIVLFYFAGRVLGGYVGRRITNRLESLLARVPIFKQVYPYVKQVVDFIFGERQIEFKSVAAVEYPRKGIWSVGFITGRPMHSIAKRTHVEMVTMFIPSSPTPFTGYTITVPRADVIELDVTVEQALRFTVSGGVLNPEVGSARDSVAAAAAAEAAGELNRASDAAADRASPSPAAAVPAAQAPASPATHGGGSGTGSG